jgi:hypothetical protein
LGMYAEKLVSARFLCAESNLVGFVIGNESLPYLAMLIVVHAEATDCDSLGH